MGLICLVLFHNLCGVWSSCVVYCGELFTAGPDQQCLQFQTSRETRSNLQKYQLRWMELLCLMSSAPKLLSYSVIAHSPSRFTLNPGPVKQGKRVYGLLRSRLCQFSSIAFLNRLTHLLCDHHGWGPCVVFASKARLDVIAFIDPSCFGSPHSQKGVLIYA